MTTGTEIITDAFAEAGVLAEDTDLGPSEMKRGLRAMNDYLTELDESGTNIGYVPITQESDEVRIRRGMVAGLKVNLGARLCSIYKKPITPELAAKIKASNAAWGRMTVKLGRVKVQSTLPRGSGNTINDNGFIRDRFFPEQDEENF